MGWKAEDTGGDTEIEKTRNWMEGRRYSGRYQDREDKKGDGRQKIQYSGRDSDREDKKEDVRQKIQGRET